MPRLVGLIALATIFLLIGILLGAWFWYLEASKPPLASSVSLYKVEISPKMTSRQIASILRARGVIRSAVLFQTLVCLYGIANRLQPGSYTFSGHETPEEVLGALLNPSIVTERITIPEGLTLKEIAQILEKNKIASATDFLEAINSPKLLEKVFSGWGYIPNAEGLACADTYYFSPGMPTEDIARQMLELTKLTVERIASAPLPLGLSLYQACILASIIEREARLAEERPLVASVFINRLKRRMRLESCATVLYALPEYKQRLTNEDLKIDSPYNTYLYSGLPPTPIANFGKASLAAVVAPASTDYLFFVSNASGGHYFSRTLFEHDRAKSIYFKERRQLEHQRQ